MTDPVIGASDVTKFIARCAPEVKSYLEQIRQTVHAAVPEATETISYGIPTFQLHGKNMVHYGPGKQHVGVYATPDGHAEFEPELSRYKRGKGSVRLPLDQPLPLDLLRRIALYRAEQIRKG